MRKVRFILVVLFTILTISTKVKSQPIDISGTWHGKLTQHINGLIITNFMTVTVNQNKNTFYGFNKNDFKNQEREYVIYNIEGEINGTEVTWADISIQSEKSLNKEWCKKNVSAKIYITADSLILFGDWANDGSKYFVKEKQKERTKWLCYPGIFRVAKKIEVVTNNKYETTSPSSKPNTPAKTDTGAHIAMHPDKNSILPVVANTKNSQKEDFEHNAPNPFKSAKDSDQIKNDSFRLHKNSQPFSDNYGEPITNKFPNDNIQIKDDSLKPNKKTTPNTDNSAIPTVNRPANERIQEMTKIKIEKKPEILTDKPLQRKILVQDTIEVISDSLELLFFDNGQIDNDTISVYYNKNLILDHKRLSLAPIKISIKIYPDRENELVMYANNLGEIIPNTALLRFIDNDLNRHFYIESDTQNSGAIILRKIK